VIGGGHTAIYVFTRNGTTWSQQAALPNPGSGNTYWDSSVAVNGDTLVIGDGSASPQGAAYVFTRANGVWTLAQTLTMSAGEAAAYSSSPSFGYSVAISGSTVMIGTRANLSGLQGTVYVFDIPTVTVASNPPGLAFTASGTGCPSGTLTTPHTLESDTGCTIAFPSPAQNGPGNTSYTFQQWDDGNTGNPRAILSLVPSRVTYTAQFSTRYLLAASASPASGGQVTGGGWYNDSAFASVMAIPNPGFLFTGFSGDLTGSATPQTLWMNGAKSLTGNFIPMPGATLSALISSKAGPQNARVWTIALADSAGSGVAYTPQIHGLILTQTYGTACVPLRTSPAAFPIVFSNLAAGTSTSGAAQFDFSACPTNARFTVVVVFTANSGTSGGATTLANQTM
jgi:hypothetical protein